MARRERLANNAETTLASSVVPADTTISVASAAKFPTEGDFRIVIDNELMLVTAVSGTTFTVTRGIEGTSAANHNQGTGLAQVLTQGGMERLIIESVDPLAFERNPYRIQDTNGNLLDSTDFTLVDVSGVATVTDNADGSISIEFLAPSATQRLVRLERNAPSTPYTIRGATFFSAAIANTGSKGPITGLHFRDSVNDETMTIRYRPLDSLDLKLGVNYYTGETFSAAQITNTRADHSPRQIWWWEIEDDGTNLKFRVSQDGVHFIQIHSELRTATLTAAPDKVGFNIINPSDTIKLCTVTLIAWDGE